MCQILRNLILTSIKRTWTQYGAIINKLNTLNDVNVIVLSGTGKHFCAGIDLKASANSFQQYSQKGGESKGLQHVSDFQKDIKSGVDGRIPIICVIHGVCYGLGLDLISATSIRLASKDSRLSIKEIDIGIMADIGSLERLPFLVNNISKLNQYALTAQEFNGQDAKDLGLVSDVFANKEEAFQNAVKLAKTIATKYPPAIYGTKKNLDLVTINSESVIKGLDQVAHDNVKLMTDPSFAKFFIKSQQKRKSKM